MDGGSLRSRLRSAQSHPFWRVVAVATGALAALTRGTSWYFRLAFAREQLGDDVAAREAYERALADPTRPADWFHRLADLHRRAQDWAAVERVYRQALDAEPSRSDFQLGRGEALEQLSRWDDAVRHYEAAAASGDREMLIRLGTAHDRRHDWSSAVAAYETALEQAPDDRFLLERLGAAKHRSGNLASAVATYRRALDLEEQEPGPGLRLRIAEVYDQAGQWDEARRWLEENLRRHPENPQSYRLLARVAWSAYELGGYFEGPLTTPDDASFHSLVVEVDALSPTTQDYLRLACWAMEAAVLVAPKRVTWTATLGSLRSSAGYEAGAVAAYGRALDLGRRSNRIPIVKSLHPWTFEFERLRYALGHGKVEDPLFDGEAVTIDPDEDIERPIGLYTLDFDFEGLRLRGLLTRQDVPAVEIRLDGRLLRKVTPSREGFLPRFAFRVDRRTLDLFPSKGRLSVATTDGSQLLAGGRGRAVELRLPHGRGTIGEILDEGVVLDKKGSLRPGRDELRRRHEHYLQLYEFTRDFFEEELGLSLFLMYGTLLGVHRDGDFIPGDDDFDAGYVSDETRPFAVKEETKRIIVHLVQSGFTVSFNRRGRLFRLQHPEVSPADIHLDLRPLWFEEGRLWVHNYVSYPSDVGDFLPVAERELRGTKVYVPRRTEAFLEAHYGPSWRVPDPSFTYHPGDVDPKVMARLDEALITPREYRELRAYLDSEEGRCPAMGRFVSLAEQPLYPLEDVL